MSLAIPNGTYKSEQYSDSQLPGSLAASTVTVNDSSITLSTNVDGKTYIVSRGSNEIVGGKVSLGSESYACIRSSNGFSLDGIHFVKEKGWY